MEEPAASKANRMFPMERYLFPDGIPLDAQVGCTTMEQAVTAVLAEGEAVLGASRYHVLQKGRTTE